MSHKTDTRAGPPEDLEGARQRVGALPRPEIRFHKSSTGTRPYVVFPKQDAQSGGRRRSPSVRLRDSAYLEWAISNDVSKQASVSEEGYLGELMALQKLAEEGKRQLDALPTANADASQVSSREDTGARRFRLADLAGAIMVRASQPQHVHVNLTAGSLEAAKKRMEDGTADVQLAALVEASEILRDRLDMNSRLLHLSRTVPAGHTFDTAWTKDDNFAADNRKALAYNTLALDNAMEINAEARARLESKDETSVKDWVSNLAQRLGLPCKSSPEAMDLIQPLEEALKTLMNNPVHSVVSAFWASSGQRSSNISVRPVWYLTSGLGRLSRRQPDTWTSLPSLNEVRVDPSPSSWGDWTLRENHSYLGPYIKAASADASRIETALSNRKATLDRAIANAKRHGDLADAEIKDVHMAKLEALGLAEHSRTMITWLVPQIDRLLESSDQQTKELGTVAEGMKNGDYQHALDRIGDKEQNRRVRDTLELLDLAKIYQSVHESVRSLAGGSVIELDNGVAQQLTQMEKDWLQDREKLESTLAHDEKGLRAEWDNRRKAETFDGPERWETVKEIMEHWKQKSERSPETHTSATDAGGVTLSITDKKSPIDTQGSHPVAREMQAGEEEIPMTIYPRPKVKSDPVGDTELSVGQSKLAAQAKRDRAYENSIARSKEQSEPPSPPKRRARATPAMSNASTLSRAASTGTSDARVRDTSPATSHRDNTRKQEHNPDPRRGRASPGASQSSRSPAVQAVSQGNDRLDVPGQGPPPLTEKDFPSLPIGIRPDSSLGSELARSPKEASTEPSDATCASSGVFVEIPVIKGPADPSTSDDAVVAFDSDGVVSLNVDSASFGVMLDTGDRPPQGNAGLLAVPYEEADTTVGEQDLVPEDSSVAEDPLRPHESEGVTLKDSTLEWVNWDALEQELARKPKTFSKLTDSWGRVYDARAWL